MTTSAISSVLTGDSSSKTPLLKAEPVATDNSGKQQYNLAILESQQQVSLGVKNEPLALLFKAAIESINAKLEPSLGSNAIEVGYEAGVDISPQATADRIVNQSTSFFAAFRQQHGELDFESALNQFTDVIKSGIDRGFEEARDILDGLKVLEGDIAANIDQTFELVQSGLSSFRQQQLESNH
ncbi:MAG: DUF5610 domain-containing protein [Spongiibacteraceae bacterium]